VIDDTYNANPDSMRAAIDVLAARSSPRVLVMGDMGEVGDNGPAFHREVGAYARERGIDVLFALGDAARESCAAFDEAGSDAQASGAVSSRSCHFDDVSQLVEHLLLAGFGASATVLVKGSRFMRMERVVDALTAQHPASGGSPGAH
jgi:UDP-N-acetylmuramoyl-tripeptide--D-alanyl-D-alanine ligase